MIWDLNDGLVIKLRPSSLAGVRSCSISMHWSSSQSFWLTFASLIVCTSEAQGVDQVDVNPSSDWGEWGCLVTYLELGGMLGWGGFSHLGLCRKENHLYSLYTTSSATGVWGGTAWSTFGGVAGGCATNAIGCWITQMTVANAWTYFDSCSKQSGWPLF